MKQKDWTIEEGQLAAQDRGSLIIASSRTPRRCATLSAVTLLVELDAFYLDQRRCSELDAGVDWPMVWIACPCGAGMARGADGDDRADR